MLDDLDGGPWADLEHAYGSAGDVPELIRTLVAGGAGWEDAAARLYASLYHQGRYVDATAMAVPYLIEALGSDGSPRTAILHLLAEFSGAHRYDTIVGHDPYAFRSGHDGLDYPQARATIDAVRAGYPTYLALLADDDPEVRALAAYTIVGCPDEGSATATVLAARLPTEPDGAVRAASVFALGRLGGAPWAAVPHERQADPATLVRHAAAIALAQVAPERADGTTLRILIEAARGEGPEQVGALAWGGRAMASLAAVAAAELGRTRPEDAASVLRAALEHRIGQGQRALTPYFWRDGPPAGADVDELTGADTSLRDLVTALAPLVFGDLCERERPVTRAELTDEQVAVLRWTVDIDLPVPVAAVPWPDAARMARFLDGPAGPLDTPLTVTWDGAERTAPAWRWFWDADDTRSATLGDAIVAALGAQRSARDLLTLARDTFTCAYRRDAWPRGPIALIRRAFDAGSAEDGRDAGGTGGVGAAAVRAELDAWARDLDGDSDRDQAWFVLGLLAEALALRGETLPEYLDDAIASAITASDSAAGLLDPLEPDRRTRIIARVRGPHWQRKLLR